MSKEELERCYENYSKEYEKDHSIGMILHKRADGNMMYRKPTIEMFEGLMDSNENFRNKWTLKEPKQR